MSENVKALNLPEMRHQLAFYVERENKAIRLLSLVGPARLDAAVREVERRAELFAEVRLSSPKRGEHPELAAFDSVINDAACGRLS